LGIAVVESWKAFVVQQAVKILFIDPMGFAYDAHTPCVSPLGGSQSALVYLAIELARQGVEVVVVNGIGTPVISEGLQFTHLPCSADFMNDFDAIVLAAAARGHMVRMAGARVPMILWCHHAADQMAVRELQSPDKRAAYQGYAMVSEWQANGYAAAFGIPRANMRIMRNAISPFFVNLPIREPWYKRGAPPVLVYTSTPFRGLDVLLTAFPLIRAKLTGVRLRIYSSMGIYGVPEADDEFRVLYELAKCLPDVEYVGALPQKQLADAMMQADIFAYPSTFAETSCISCMEAMAAGTFMVTTSLGALPETAAGFAVMLEDKPLRHPSFLATEYAHTLVSAVANLDPQETARRRIEQIQYASEHYTWARRASEWIAWLTGLTARAGAV
jgi:glycosyltransferase involved in cell wall biosynthesis